jgi:hypothetical protein
MDRLKRGDRPSMAVDSPLFVFGSELIENASQLYTRRIFLILEVGGNFVSEIVGYTDVATPLRLD